VQPDFTDENGLTLLHLAALGLRAISRFEHLLNAGVAPGATTRETGLTALHLTAIATGFTAFRHWIDKEGHDYTQEQRNKRATKISNTLLDADPQLARKRDSLGRTALHYSANIGSHQLSIRLAEHDPETLLIRDDNGSRPPTLLSEHPLRHCLSPRPSTPSLRVVRLAPRPLIVGRASLLSPKRTTDRDQRLVFHLQ
jgi:ankyrin repeat protein